MSASLRSPDLVLVAAALQEVPPPRHAAPGWRRRWERPLTWWAVIALCSGFWYGVLRLLGAL